MRHRRADAMISPPLRPLADLQSGLSAAFTDNELQFVPQILVDIKIRTVFEIHEHLQGIHMDGTELGSRRKIVLVLDGNRD